MIFVTVGTQLAFDRMIKAVDEYYCNAQQKEIFAQIGPSKYKPKNMAFSQFISPTDADDYFKKADLVIAHAGTGSIFTALKYKKPIIIMPRSAELHEHRNDHQIATTKWAKKLPGVWAVDDEKELILLLESGSIVGSSEEISSYAQPELINFLKLSIQQL